MSNVGPLFSCGAPRRCHERTAPTPDTSCRVVGCRSVVCCHGTQVVAESLTGVASIFMKRFKTDVNRFVQLVARKS